MARKQKKAEASSARRSAPTSGTSRASAPSVPTACLMLALVTLAVFAPACGFDFLDYDDNIFITENAHVQGGFTADNLAWAFQNNVAFLWHPLTWMSHMLDYKLHGLKPGGHHLTSIMIHAASAVLLFLALRRITGAHWCSLIVAALFAWHPLHVESVAWISERKDVLSGLFWMLTLWSYGRYVEKPGLARYAQVILWFALGLMSKPMAVTLPCVLLLLDVWPLGRVKLERDTAGRLRVPWPDVWKVAREKIPMFVLVALVSVLTVRIMDTSGGLISTNVLPLSLRAANAVVSYARYFGEVFWAFDLCIFYPFPAAWPIWAVLGAIVLVLGISAVTLRMLVARSYLAVGWFWFLGTLVPTIGFVQNGNQSIADRYTYLPYVGLFIALVWGAGAWAEWRPQWRQTIRFGTGAALVACLVLTTMQLQYWRNTSVLFTRALAVTKNNFIAETIVADALVAQGKRGEAITHYRNALRIVPGLTEANNNLGNALFAEGKMSEAAACYRAALAIRPDFAEAHAGLGLVLAAQGANGEAIPHFRESLKRYPDQPEILDGLGKALAIEGRYADAEVEMRRAMAFNDCAAIRNNLAKVLVLQKKTAEAIIHYRAALRFDPNLDTALNGLAWQLAVQPDPQLRDGAAAVQMALRACEQTQYQNANFLNTLAAAYAETGRFSEAAVTAQKATVLAYASGQEALGRQLEGRLKLYTTGQPFHEAAP